MYANKHMFCGNALAGDLTEKQKKIFRENKFYHGYTIPEPKEMVRKVATINLHSIALHLFSCGCSMTTFVAVREKLNREQGSHTP